MVDIKFTGLDIKYAGEVDTESNAVDNQFVETDTKSGEIDTSGSSDRSIYVTVMSDIVGNNLKDTKSAEVYFKSAGEVEPKIPTVNSWSVEAGVKSGETDTNNSSARSIYMMAVSDTAGINIKQKQCLASVSLLLLVYIVQFVDLVENIWFSQVCIFAIKSGPPKSSEMGKEVDIESVVELAKRKPDFVVMCSKYAVTISNPVQMTTMEDEEGL